MGFPLFSEFVEFVSDKEELACDPQVSQQSAQALHKTVVPAMGNAKSSNDNHLIHGHVTDALKPHQYVPKCMLCKESLYLDNCKQLLSKSMYDKTLYIKDNRLCSACLKPNHLASVCKRLICNICKKSHPSSLHGTKFVPSDQSYNKGTLMW